MSDPTKTCRCGEPMQKIHDEVLCFDGARPFPNPLPVPAVTIFWECATCKSVCVERSGFYVDRGQVPSEEWG